MDGVTRMRRSWMTGSGVYRGEVTLESDSALMMDGLKKEIQDWSGSPAQCASSWKRSSHCQNVWRSIHCRGEAGRIHSPQAARIPGVAWPQDPARLIMRASYPAGMTKGKRSSIWGE